MVEKKLVDDDKTEPEVVEVAPPESSSPTSHAKKERKSHMKRLGAHLRKIVRSRTPGRRRIPAEKQPSGRRLLFKRDGSKEQVDKTVETLGETVKETTTTTTKTKKVEKVRIPVSVTKKTSKTTTIAPAQPPIAPASEPLNVVKVDDSLLPEYVQTNEPIVYSSGPNRSTGVYYTNKLERNPKLQWEKPDWADKPKLKSMPNVHDATGSAMGKPEKQVEWEKPAWATKNVLKLTDQGAKIKSGKDIVRPITATTTTSDNAN